MNLLSKTLIKIIEIYQRKGGGRELFRVDCNFTPSCSEYTKQAIQNFGFLPGIKLGIERIRQCNEMDLIVNIKDPIPLAIKRKHQKSHYKRTDTP
jgi:hypothetical protein